VRYLLLLFLATLTGCSSAPDSNVHTVSIEKFGVVHEKTAPKTVVVGDTYEVKTEIKTK
jgi:hypothetical protein